MNDDRVVASTADDLWALRLRQCESWQRGERLTVEALVATSESSLPDDALLELILSEFQLREEFGEQPSPDEYMLRFPQLRRRLERLFAVRAAMDNTESGQAGDQATDSELPEREVSRIHASPTIRGYTSPEIAANPIEERMLGSYRLLEKLGEGGMGVVYKAQHQKLKKTVSIKLLPKHLTSDASLTARFQREMESVGALDHPNIVRAMDAGEVDGTHFLVMELVDGDDLAKVVKTSGPLPISEACAVIQQAAAALHHAHDHGLVHRDIKPSNLMWTRDKCVKLLDLGLARWQLEAKLATESELTDSGQALGTIDYMSPEQARNSKGVDGRSDIYSLGCTLYFLLTGQPLYAGRSRVEKLFAHRDDPIPSLHASRGDIPAELDRVYQRMVAKRPEDRYASMTEVMHALEDVRLDCTSTGQSPATVLATGAPSENDTATARLGEYSGNGNAASDRAGALPLPTPKQQPNWRVSLLVVAGVLLGGLGLFGVITVTTPDGKLIIESEVDDVDVVVLRQGRQVKVIDKQTGSQVTLDSGDYSLALKDDRNDVQLSKNRITLKRGDREIVKITRVLPGAGWQGWPADAPAPAIAPFDAVQAKKHQDEWAAYLNVPVEYTNSLGMKFMLIPPGEFTMGSTAEEIAAALKEVGEDKQWQECIKSEAPQHKVILTQPIYLGVNEVSQAEYEKVMGVSPSHFAPMGMGKEAVAGLETAEYPVETVSWNDAAEFCAKLSQQEKLKPFYFRAGETITPLDGTGYRLPSEAEWEFSCRAGTATKYWIGDKDEDLVRAGWFGGNSGGRTHAAGELRANPFGLYDIHGNIWEWMQDGWDATWYDQFSEKPAINPNSPFSPGSRRVVRGGSLQYPAFPCRSSVRFTHVPSDHHSSVGFRVSLMAVAVKELLKREQRLASAATASWHGWPADAPPPAIAPFDAAQAKLHQEAWAKYLNVPVEYTNSLEMKFRLIPPGKFLMGITEAEFRDIQEHTSLDEFTFGRLKSEMPQHSVTLTQPFFLGIYEVTQRDYKTIMGVNPSHFSTTGNSTPEANKVAGMNTETHPVEGVRWNDAAAFCEKLSQMEKLSPVYQSEIEGVKILAGTGYRLPTEAEWEFSCRSGTTQKFWNGNSDINLRRTSWFASWPSGATHPVGQLEANPFGLYDTHGNVREWCHDRGTANYYNQFSTEPAIDPRGSTEADSLNVLRGGDWSRNSDQARSATRDYGISAQTGDSSTGFRVALSVDAVRQRLKVTGTGWPNPAATKLSALPTTTVKDSLKQQGGAAVAKKGWHGWPADQQLAPDDVPELLSLAGHTERVRGVCVNKDGTRIASSSDDKTVRVWDTTTGQLVRLFTEHEKTVWRLAFSPEGKRIASPSSDGTVKVWEADTGKVQCSFSGHGEKDVVCAAFSPDGKRVASGGADWKVRIWDATTGKEELVLSGHTFDLIHVAFSPDGKRVVSGSWDGTVRIWNSETGAEERRLAEHPGGAFGVCFSPDGKRLATCGRDGCVKIWDLDAKTPVLIFSQHNATVVTLAFSPDGEWIASSGDDQAVRIWSSTTGKEAVVFRGVHSHYVCFSTDGRKLVATASLVVKVWDVSALSRLPSSDAPAPAIAPFDAGQAKQH